MSRWLKRAALTVAAVIVLIAMFVVLAYALTSVRARKTYHLPDAAPPAAAGSAAVERGRHIAVAVGKCLTCHGDDLGGQVMADDAAFGRLVASNLTRGRGGVGADYADADWERAIRHGVGPDGRPLVFMPADAFWPMSDGDLADLIAFLRTVPPVDRELAATRVGPMAAVLSVAVGLPLLPAASLDHAAARRPPTPGENADYGEYLATVGGCKGCHGPELAGDGAPGVPDISPARLGSWTEADFKRALRAGVRPDGTAISTEMPWVYAGKMTDAEIRAVWMYVRTLVPLPGEG